MIRKMHGNQELPSLPGRPPVLTKISKWYLGHPIFVQHLWKYIFYTYRGKVSNTIRILLLIKKEIYSKPILKPFISLSPPLPCHYKVPNNFNSSPTPPNLKLSYFFILIQHVILRIPTIFQALWAVLWIVCDQVRRYPYTQRTYWSEWSKHTNL